MRHTTLAGLIVVALVVACETPPPVTRPPAQPLPQPQPVASPPIAAVPLTSIADWGVAIMVPPGATSEHDASNERHTLQLEPCGAPSPDQLAYNSCRTVLFSREHRPAPATLAEASKLWDAANKSASADPERAAATLDEGTLPSGGFFTIRSFDIRVGFSSHGRNVHTFRRITRVYAVLALDSSTHISCTGYWEQGAENKSDPTIVRLREVCSSMQRR